VNIPVFYRFFPSRAVRSRLFPPSFFVFCREIRQTVTMPVDRAEGMKLIRFDKVLGLTREQIARAHQRETPSRAATV
jgi:hypothetical protein